ncbi:SETMR methyltransferase, partial [Acromyrmex insinuator]
PTSAPSRTTVYRWFSEFKMGHTSTEDVPRSGRAKEATNAEIAKQVHRIVLNDRKVKLRELTEAVGISKERAGYILHDVLEIKKLSARWVPRLLTIDQKQQRTLKFGKPIIQQPKYRYLENITSIDEIGYFTFSNNSDIDAVREYFSMGRYANVDCFYLCQTYARIPKHLIRDNANLTRTC